MKNKLSVNLNIKPQHKLIITPQMKLSLNILQMNMIDIIKEINTIIEDNPALEEAEEHDLFNWDTDENHNKNVTTTEHNQDIDNIEGRELPYTKKTADDEINYENFVAQPLTLEEHLLFQLRISGLNNLSKVIGEYIIGNLDQNGYFRLDINEVAKELKVSTNEILDVLKIIQRFDPTGIASRNLKECINIQLHDMQIDEVLINDIEEIIDIMGDTNIYNMQTVLQDKNYSNDYSEYLSYTLKKIDPKPGLKYSENASYIYPDVYIQNLNDGFNVFVNERDLPVLRVNDYYLKLLERGNLDEKTKEYIEEKIRKAEWVIRSLKLRKQAILKVTEAIVDYQREFFLNGYDYLKPMKLKDIADRTELHESTVSRVTSGKYAHTKYGLIELKMLFIKGYNTVDGAMSVDNIKKLISSIIKEEPLGSPFSDKKISEILMERGVQIARRTVTKYREELKIPAKISRKKEI